MSDPARDGYECHGPMQPVGYLGESEVVGMICVTCGVTRNMVREVENPGLRARVDRALYEMADTIPRRQFIIPEPRRFKS